MNAPFARRHVVIGALLIFVLAGCDWAQFRGGAARTGFNAGEGCCGQTSPITTANVSGLHLLWSAAVGGAPTWEHNYAGNPVISTGNA